MAKELNTKEVEDKLAHIAEKMATQDDLKGMATKEDLKGMATQDDIARVVENMATKEDVKLLDQRLTNIEAQLADIKNDVVDIRRRVERLEEQGASQAGYAKEIDYLLEQVAKMQKQIRALEKSS